MFHIHGRQVRIDVSNVIVISFIQYVCFADALECLTSEAPLMRLPCRVQHGIA